MDQESSDHAAKFVARNAPPVDILAEAKRILKRARGDDEQQGAANGKWRQVEPEPMSSDENNVEHNFISDRDRSQFDSCEEDMEAPGVHGQGEASELIGPPPESTPRESFT